jgi:hypothetical protein
MWISLVLYLPIWIGTQDANRHTMTKDVVGGCSVLYVVAMEAWWHPQCAIFGPNDVIYCSLIFNCFIMYAFVRVVLIGLQNTLMSGMSTDVNPLTLQSSATSSRTWIEAIGKR